MYSNDTKPFIMMSTSLLQILSSSLYLNPSESSLWLFIYSSSYHSPQKETCISYLSLSKKTGFSVRTLERLASSLKKKGFLEWIQISFKKSKPTNCYKCSLPPNLKHHLMPLHNKNSRQEFSQEYIERKKSFEFDKEYQEMIDGGEAQIPTPIIEYKISPKKIFTSATDDHLYIKDNISINTQCSDCEFSTSSKVEELKKELNEAEKYENKANNEAESLKNISNTKDSMAYLIKLKEIGSNEAKKSFFSNRIIWIRKEIDKENNKISIDFSLKNKENFINEEKGERKIPLGLIWWIKQKLFSFGLEKKSIPKIINEIVYSVRFGSLSKIKYTSTQMPLMKSVNIALKLIRQGKWQTPALFLKEIEIGNLYGYK